MFRLFRTQNNFSKQIKNLTGFKPGRIQLYELALVPKSSSPSLPGTVGSNNERLEYLGDAILAAIISDYLFKTFPNRNEGFLTKIRSKFVKRQYLNQLGRKIGLNELISPPIYQNQHKKNISGDTLEAFVGAIYIDKGYDAAKKFVIDKLIHDYTDIENLVNHETDFKSQIIEWGQKHKVIVNFKTSEETKPEQEAPYFKARVLVSDKKGGSGSGLSKKEAEQNAAKKALKYIQNNYLNNETSTAEEL